MAHSTIGSVSSKSSTSGAQGGAMVADLLQLIADMAKTGGSTSGLQSLLDMLKTNQTSAATQVQGPAPADDPDPVSGDSAPDSPQGIMKVLLQLMMLMLSLLSGDDQGGSGDPGVGSASKPATSVAKNVGSGNGGNSSGSGNGNGSHGGNGGASGTSGTGSTGGHGGKGGGSSGVQGGGGSSSTGTGTGTGTGTFAGTGTGTGSGTGTGAVGAPAGTVAPSAGTGTFNSVDPAIQQWAPDIDKAAAATGLDPNLIGGQMWAESRGDPTSVSRNSDGTLDYGTMQIGQERWLGDVVPTLTAQDRANIKAATGKEAEALDVTDPHDNVIAGAFELKMHIAENGGTVNGGLAAYVGVGDEQAYVDHVLTNQAALAAGQPMDDSV